MENNFERLLELAEENNKMLRKMRRNQKIAGLLKFVYWVIILGILFGAYYFLQPYITSFNKNLQSLQNTLSSISSTTNNLPNNIPGISEMKQFLENIKSSN
ncbi:hypothetical protein SDC9_07738 [bioreactor metagenome]|uniref:Uncharacterized protein n=1 Tax=bioreactor metagenome TaxID=1076179 RepID=A0A644T5C3_9ZZZZ|nr:hypothetical protein [Candidatus Elulimicrobiales bacterium]